jgi:hypothetical protein
VEIYREVPVYLYHVPHVLYRASTLIKPQFTTLSGEVVWVLLLLLNADGYRRDNWKKPKKEKQ